MKDKHYCSIPAETNRDLSKNSSRESHKTHRTYKTHRTHGSHSGVSLLELLIYIAIFSIIMVFLVVFFTVIIRSRAVANARFEVQENLRFAMEKIQQSVLDMAYIDVSGACPLNTLKTGTGLATTTFQVSNGILQMREGDNNPFNDITSSSTVTIAGLNDTTCIFSKISNPAPARSTLQLKLKVSYNDRGNTALKFSDLGQITISLR